MVARDIQSWKRFYRKPKVIVGCNATDNEDDDDDDDGFKVTG
jgi:hypothetical protein